MSKRSPYDGYPYYCKVCGLGWPEYQACEETDCELESELSARARKKVGINTLKATKAIDLVEGDVVYMYDNTLKTVKEVHPGYGHILKGAEGQERCCMIVWQEGEFTITLRTQECILASDE